MTTIFILLAELVALTAAILLTFLLRRQSSPVAGGLHPEPRGFVTLTLDIPLDGGASTFCVNRDDFRRTGDVLRCCAKLMDEAAKADPAECEKLLQRTRNLTEHWFGVIGLDAARKEQVKS